MSVALCAVSRETTECPSLFIEKENHFDSFVIVLSSFPRFFVSTSSALIRPDSRENIYLTPYSPYGLKYPIFVWRFGAISDFHIKCVEHIVHMPYGHTDAEVTISLDKRTPIALGYDNAGP